MRVLVQQAAQDIASQTGTQIDLQLHESYPGIVNTDACVSAVQRAAEALLGARQVHVLSAPTMMTEDFGFYLDSAPGCFYHIGAGCTAPLHSPQFLPDIRAAVTAAALHAAVLTQALRS